MTEIKPPPYSRDRVAYVQSGRPAFFDDPAIDKLLAMTMALLGEVCVLRDRLDTHERLAAEGKVATPEAVEAFVAASDTAGERTAARQKIMDRVLSVLTEDVVRLREEGKL